MDKGTYQDSYAIRDQKKDLAEYVFKLYCTDKSLECDSYGFQSKRNIPKYWTVHAIARNTPDYVVHKLGADGKSQSSFVCNIKGTCRIKAEELFYYKLWASLLGELPVYVIFGFDDNNIQSLYFYTIPELEREIAMTGRLMYYEDNKIIKLVNEFRINSTCKAECVNGNWTVK